MGNSALDNQRFESDQTTPQSPEAVGAVGAGAEGMRVGTGIRAKIALVAALGAAPNCAPMEAGTEALYTPPVAEASFENADAEPTLRISMVTKTDDGLTIFGDTNMPMALSLEYFDGSARSLGKTGTSTVGPSGFSLPVDVPEEAAVVYIRRTGDKNGFPFVWSVN